MKIAIPIQEGTDLQAQVSQTFGRAPSFLIVDQGTKEFEIIENTVAQDAHGAGPGAASLLIRHGAKGAIAGRFGPNAFGALQGAGVQMYICGPDTTIATALERLEAGELELAQNN